MPKITPDLLNDTLSLIQIARETALAKGSQEQAEQLMAAMDDPDDPVAQMVASGVARPLMPHIGTRPNVYYINDLKRRG